MWASPPTTVYRTCTLPLPCHSEPVLTLAWESVPPVLPPSVREVARSAGGRDMPRQRRGIRGDAPQGYLFRFAPLRGHRPLRPSTAPAPCPYPVIPSQCSHWRGNPYPAPAGAEHPRGGLSKGTFRAPARGTFAHGGKSTQKRRSNLRFENPCAPSPVAYLACFCHANAMPCKLPLNVALSLLLFSLPLSL